MAGVRKTKVKIILKTLSDDAPKHPEAPYGAYGACGAGFFFSLSRSHYGKTADERSSFSLALEEQTRVRALSPRLPASAPVNFNNQMNTC